MTRIRLKNGGKPRKKAFLGADGAVMAAATLAAAGINAAATANAAKTQADSVIEGAKTQAQTIKDQTENNNALQKESINFTRQQNQENRQQQQDIQMTLQMLAGQQNMNDIMERQKASLKLGGKPKRLGYMQQPFYGGAVPPFQVTDGGGVLPIQTDINGFGLYELYGNDHEHYHKAPGGKHKTGVGIRFNNGSVVEGEGNQNTNQGELLYVTPTDAMFISKHSIGGFNPTEAVKNGVHPIEAFNIQEFIKAVKGLKDDGSKNKKYLGGSNILANMANTTQFPTNTTAPIATGAAYLLNKQTSSPIAKNGTRVSLKKGGRCKAAWGDWAGATYSSAGNLLGSGVNAWGNMWAAGQLGDAYTQAGNILSNAYSQMKGIDLSEIRREDYEAPHTLATIRLADTNINPQLERIRRNASFERREINRGTSSSAARQQRLAATNDRMFQRMGEQYAYKDNLDEQIKQQNAAAITQTAMANAERDVKARQNYANQRLSLLQYNNNIENSRIAGMAQAEADALTQSSAVRANALQSSLAGIGSALQSTGTSFGAAYDKMVDRVDKYNTALGGSDPSVATQLIIAFNDKENARTYYNRFANSGDANLIKQANLLAAKFGFATVTPPNN